MSEQKPTVVFVHGAFAESTSWELVIDSARPSIISSKAGLRPTLLAEHSLQGGAAASPLRGVAAMPPTCET